MPDSTDSVLSCLGVVKACLLWSEITVSIGLCLDLSCSLDTKSAESDDKDRYFPPFTACIPEVIVMGDEKDVFVAGLLDLRKEKMDGALMLCGDLEGDGDLVGI